MLKSICKLCNVEFRYSEHHSKGIYCKIQCRTSFEELIRKSKLKTCKQCSILTANPKFCSTSCSAIYNNTGTIHSSDTKLKISKSVSKTKPKGRYKTLCHISWCRICNTYIPDSKRKTCSVECLNELYTKQGQHLAKSINKRSLQEIELFTLCQSSFINVTNNEIIIDGWDADIVLKDYKIAILWNGPWHYKQMPLNNHSLSQVQTRDKLKVKKFTNNGWITLMFEDRHYTPISAFIEIKLVVDKRIELLYSAYETDVLPLN